MKAIMVSPEFIDKRSGGIARYIYNLSNELIKKNYDIDIITFLDEQPRVLYYENFKPSVHNLGVPNSGYVSQIKQSYLAARYVKNLIRQGEKCDIIHSHETSSFFFSIFYNLDIPLVLTYHGVAFLFKQPKKHALYFIRILINLLQLIKCRKMIVLNSKNLDDANRVKLGSKVNFIPNGVCNFLRKNTSNNLIKKVPNSDFIFLYVGRLAPMKGLEILLKAIEYIKINHTNIYLSVKLLIIGDGPSYNQLIAEKKLSNLDNVHFLGWVEDDKLNEFYHDSDAFIFPSLGEGMPTVILEAMSAGLPIISSRIPGITDVVTSDFGILVTPNDHVALAEAIIKLFNNRENLEEMKLMALAESKRYNWDHIIDSIINVYEEEICKRDT